MSDEEELLALKGRIAEVYARRERLKLVLESGAPRTRAGLARLEAIDQELSELDSRYKALWDAHHGRAPRVAAVAGAEGVPT